MIFLEKRQDNMDGDPKWMGILLVAPSVLIPLYLVFFYLGVWQVSRVLYPLCSVWLRAV